MTYPIVLQYREGGEVFTVDARGMIGRPAIGMAPSGGWRFLGIVSDGRVTPFVELLKRLAAGEALPQSVRVWDLDHGSMRHHGGDVAWLRLMAGADIVECERLAVERRAAEHEAEAKKEAARLAEAQKHPVLWRDERYKVELREARRFKGPRFYVVDHHSASEALEQDEAAKLLGETILSCAQDEEAGNAND